MEFKDIITWTISADHKARPKSNFSDLSKDGSLKLPTLIFRNAIPKEEIQFIDQHTYHCDETLAPGDYPAEMFDSPVWQIEHTKGWGNLELHEVDLYVNSNATTRQFLPLKQQVQGPDKNLTSANLLSESEIINGYIDELGNISNATSKVVEGVKTIEEIIKSYNPDGNPWLHEDDVVGAMETYAQQRDDRAISVIKEHIAFHEKLKRSASVNGILHQLNVILKRLQS